ncbi:MAG: hypothetical protein M1823_000710 [Watsoniomyces obsoletus]|nr:MAG: hypothetical protein M1823_000710 [Watsoniomyces obsoletus]
MLEHPSSLPISFQQRKRKIVNQISSNEYTDRSPQGFIDSDIRHLINDINLQEGLVTTSSCAGRVSIFLEGRKSLQTTIPRDQSASQHGIKDEQKNTMMPEMDNEASVRLASAGGKGGDGRWLWVSHSPVPEPDPDDEMYYSKLFGLSSTRNTGRTDSRKAGTRYVHFKFEPMILHVWTASLAHAQMVLTAALHAGFRESGGVNIHIARRDDQSLVMPMVGIRCQGLALETIIGSLPDTNEAVHDAPEALVTEEYLTMMVGIANERFAENTARTEKFRAKLLDLYQVNTHRVSQLGAAPRPQARSVGFEDTKTRRGRKRAEGLARKQTLQQQHEESPSPSREEQEELDFSILEFLS